jgi:hypothetical protein
MELIFSWWAGLTVAQATLFAGACTPIAALIAVLLGSSFFDGKVISLKDAITASGKVLDEHISKIETYQSALEEKLTFIEQITLDNGATAAKISGEDDQDEIDAIAPEADIASNKLKDRETLLSHWSRVKSVIEEKASDPQIDGRTRARYNRIDRRNYKDLVDALVKDSKISSVSKTIYEAIELRNSFRNGKKEISSDDIDAMNKLADKIELAKI